MGAALYCIVMFAYWAYRIRMGAIEEYGPVIHEFDPYFNYRATEVRMMCEMYLHSTSNFDARFSQHGSSICYENDIILNPLKLSLSISG